MNDYINIMLAVIFGGMGGWMIFGWARTRQKIKIKDRRWNASRILFVVAGVTAAATLLLQNTLLDYVREICMIAAIIGFLMMRDGLGEDGLVNMGRFTAWKQVRGYDFTEDKKKTTVYFQCMDTGAKKKDDYVAYIDFDKKDTDQVKHFLKEKIGNKYTRMKKN